MKRSTNCLFFVIIVVVFSITSLFAEEREVDWDKYSKSLIQALKSDNEGVRLSAMQQIIRYSENLKVTQARYDVMDIFQNHQDQKVRQLALVTLSKIDNFFDVGYLERHLDYEENPVIKGQITAILIEKGRLSAPDMYMGEERVEYAQAD